MSVTYKDLLTLPSLNKLKIVAGDKGLCNTVRWVHIAEVLDDIRQVIDWVQGGELLFITGIGIKNDLNVFLDFIKSINSKNVAGLVVFIGPYLYEIPQEVIELANNISFPVFEIPWEVRLVEVTHEICSYIAKKEAEQASINNLLENLLLHHYNNEDALVEQASFYGYNITPPFQASIIDIDQFGLFLKSNNIKEEHLILNFKKELHQIVKRVLTKYYGKILTFPLKDSIITLIPSTEQQTTDLNDVLLEIKEQIPHTLNNITVSIGVGNEYSKIIDFKKSVIEAQKVLKIIKQIHSFNTILYYKDLGIYTLLLEINTTEPLKAFQERMLKNLETYNYIDSAVLLETLTVYLDENRSLIKTAERLFIHRNTLKYRLDKIQKLCGCNLENAQDCFNLRLALYIRKFLGIQPENNSV